MNDLEAGHPVMSGYFYKVLLQTALLGPEIGAAQESQELVEHLIDLRPDLPHAPIFRAMSIFRLGRPNEGIAELKEVVERFPDSHLAKAMLGCCLQWSGQAGWMGLFDAVTHEAKDEHALGLVAEATGRPMSLNAVSNADMELPPLPPHAMWA